MYNRLDNGYVRIEFAAKVKEFISFVALYIFADFTFLRKSFGYLYSAYVIWTSLACHLLMLAKWELHLLGISWPLHEPGVAVAIREQLYEIAFQSVASARETRISKKGRREAEHVSSSKGSGIALDLVKLFDGKSSVIRKEWDLYEPIVDLLSNEEVETLDAREERNARNGIYSVSNPFLIRDGIKFPFLIELATTISETEFIPFLFRF
ncbi:hypothetical protein Syun_012014 [Stephania yunnanensis]|uniref:Uncharacterized protein n=1 Tax=Stephania yunnanensis TaxID=152371 RepID=A0AAP0PH36_9MAGN